MVMVGEQRAAGTRAHLAHGTGAAKGAAWWWWVRSVL